VNGRTPKGQPIPAQRRAPNTPQAPAAEPRNKGRDGLFNIGSSLTVSGSLFYVFSSFILTQLFQLGPGNILTVADDLLKNDGQKFLEMMEQLAERRMQREEDAAGAIEVESDEDSEDDGDGSERDDDGEDDGDASDEDEDDEDEEDGDEEVRIQSSFISIQLIILFLPRPCPRSKRWKKANECFPSLLHACSNNVYCRPIGRKLLRNVNYSFSASLMMKTRLPRTVR